MNCKEVVARFSPGFRIDAWVRAALIHKGSALSRWFGGSPAESVGFTQRVSDGVAHAHSS